jgi:hypothetical protein
MLSDIIRNIGQECGYQVVTSNINNSTDVTTKMLLGMCNRIAKEMADAYEWQKLRKSYSFALEDGVSTYALPDDFSYYHYETFWNQSTQWRLYGALNQQQYGERIGYGDLASVYDEFQIRGVTDKEITIYPTPDAGKDGEVITFEYTSARPIRPKTWTASTLVNIGTYLFYNGNYYTVDATYTTGSTAPTHTTGSTNGLTYYDGKYESFLADTDVCVLSERVLEQGVMERFGSIKQLNIPQLFQSQLDTEYAKSSAGKVLYAANSNLDNKFQYAINGRVAIGS